MNFDAKYGLQKNIIVLASLQNGNGLSRFQLHETALCLFYLGLKNAVYCGIMLTVSLQRFTRKYTLL